MKEFLIRNKKKQPKKQKIINEYLDPGVNSNAVLVLYAHSGRLQHLFIYFILSILFYLFIYLFIYLII